MLAVLKNNGQMNQPQWLYIESIEHSTLIIQH